jgi:hypothetical protein
VPLQRRARGVCLGAAYSVASRPSIWRDDRRRGHGGVCPFLIPKEPSTQVPASRPRAGLRRRTARRTMRRYVRPIIHGLGVWTVVEK